MVQKFLNRVFNIQESLQNNFNPLVSILIPVYNAEKYLEKCLDSCINQTYKNIEVICVNDGSIDNSLNLLNRFAEKDSRIKVFSQQNAGIAKAYEKAVKESSGEWIYLLDNDDWLNLKAIELLVDFASKHNTDYIYCKYQTWYMDETGEYITVKHPVFKYKTIGFKKFKNYVSPYKFFRKSLYDGVIFPENLCEYQDSCLSWQLICNAQKPVISDLNIYYYRVRKDSVSHKKIEFDKSYISYTKAWNAVKEFLINTGKWEKMKWPLYYWGISSHRHFYRNSCNTLSEEQAYNNFKNFINNIEDDVRFLFYHKEEYDLLKYSNFKTFQEYNNIPKLNLIKRKLFLIKNLKK